ncbi:MULTISPECIES: XrtA system polysaccharide deacetylase [Deferrisoma]
MPQPSPSFPSAFTVDVEDYFHVSAFEAVCPPETWEARELRVERNTDRVLEVLAEFGVRATFFVLGWVAERCPGLVRRISAAGHEIACHGYGHRRVTTLTREAFRDDVRRAKGLLEDLAGVEVRGYRAPSYSIGPTTLWAFDELLEAGFTYDSSVFPVRHDLYGLAEWPRFPFRLERLEGEGAGNWVPLDPGAEPGSPSLLEVPVTPVRLLGRNWPAAGGGYFRLLPYAVTRWALRRILRADRRPFVFYVHPWELDPDQPRIEGAGLKSRFRHYLNLRRTEPRLRRLLSEFSFAPIREVVPETAGG